LDVERNEMIKDYEANKAEWVRLLKTASHDLELKDSEIEALKRTITTYEEKLTVLQHESNELREANLGLEESRHRLTNEISTLTHKHSLELSDLDAQLRAQAADHDAKVAKLTSRLQ
jgi:chromosome segregation ATPase